MSKDKSVAKGKPAKVEVIKGAELEALNQAAIGIYHGRRKYVDMLYQVMLASPATISTHANYLADLDEKSGGGRSGTLIKTLRANLRYLKTAHNLKATPTVKALEKDGPLQLTTAVDKPRKPGGKTAVKGESHDITLTEIAETVRNLCKGMKRDTREKVADMLYDAAMGSEVETSPDDDESGQ